MAEPVAKAEAVIVTGNDAILEDILKYQDAMGFLLLRYQVIKRDNYDRAFKDLDTLTTEELANLRAFVFNFFNAEFKELSRIFNMPIDNSPNGAELWDRYFKKGKTNLIEMRMFLAQSIVCRKKWNKCPYPKKKKGKHGDAETNGQQNANSENPTGE